MKFFSNDFSDYGPLDKVFTKEGEDISPTLHIDDVPHGAKCLVMTVHDLDSPGDKEWVHWLVWSIPANTTSISSKNLPKGAIEGVNDFGDLGYGGPLPTVGSGDHRYVFSLYALDTEAKFDPKLSREAILKEMAGNIMSQSMWVGTYRREAPTNN